MAAGLLEGTTASEMLEVARGKGLDLAAALEGGEAELRATEIAQPALLFVEVMLTRSVPDDVQVVAAVGHSAGEYAALVAAGVLSPGAAMRLVIERGRLMATSGGGAMSAVLGLDDERVREICEEVSGADHGVVVVANLNAPGQVVISGTAEAVASAAELAKARGARQVRPLAVSGAFHSPLMRDAAAAFARELDAAAFSDAVLPVVSNVDAHPVREAAELKERLRRHLVSPVLWAECVRRLPSLGVEALVELGPGRVLTGLARRILPEVPALNASSLEEVRTLPERLPVVPAPQRAGKAEDE